MISHKAGIDNRAADALSQKVDLISIENTELTIKPILAADALFTRKNLLSAVSVKVTGFE